MLQKKRYKLNKRKLQKILSERGIFRIELARMMGVSRQRITQLLTTNMLINERTARKIADTLDIDINDIITKTYKPVSEGIIQKNIIRYLKDKKYWYVKYSPTNYGGKTGTSDIISCQPGTGKLIAIEVKRQGYKPTKKQQRFIETIRNLGGIAFVARSVEDVKKELE